MVRRRIQCRASGHRWQSVGEQLPRGGREAEKPSRGQHVAIHSTRLECPTQGQSTPRTRHRRLTPASRKSCRSSGLPRPREMAAPSLAASASSRKSSQSARERTRKSPCEHLQSRSTEGDQGDPQRSRANQGAPEQGCRRAQTLNALWALHRLEPRGRKAAAAPPRRHGRRLAQVDRQPAEHIGRNVSKPRAVSHLSNGPSSASVKCCSVARSARIQ